MPVPAHIAPRECLLPGLLDRLDESLQDDAGPQLIRLHADDHGFAVGLLALPRDRHPVEAVLGLEAESDWEGVGLATDGTAWSTDPAGDTEPTRVRVLHVVDRAGASSSRVRPLDGEGPVLRPATPEGHVDDACRRILGLPTPPPPCSPAAWVAGSWLERILLATLRHPARVWDWPALARCHPASGRARPPSRRQLIQAGRRVEAVGWGEVRAAAVTGSFEHEVTPAVAAWMDDGTFARWLLGRHADPFELLADLAAFVGAADLAAVGEVLDAWGLHVPADPSEPTAGA